MEIESFMEVHGDPLRSMTVHHENLWKSVENIGGDFTDIGGDSMHLLGPPRSLRGVSTEIDSGDSMEIQAENTKGVARRVLIIDTIGPGSFVHPVWRATCSVCLCRDYEGSNRGSWLHYVVIVESCRPWILLYRMFVGLIVVCFSGTLLNCSHDRRSPPLLLAGSVENKCCTPKCAPRRHRSPKTKSKPSREDRLRLRLRRRWSAPSRHHQPSLSEPLLLLTGGHPPPLYAHITHGGKRNVVRVRI